MKLENPLFVTIAVTSIEQLTSVYALLGGAMPVAKAAAPKAEPAPSANAPATTGETLAETASLPVDDGTVDAHGWAWSESLHASTKGMTKDGLWRMKVGVTRPDPKPGFPLSIGSTGTANTGEASSAPASAPAEDAGQDDDEFAAFRAAAAKSDAEDAAAKASVPARKWTDADLGALCNQAATKLGDPAPVKEIIAKFVPEGEVSHSRNIPDDKRAEFAAAVEAKLGIEFAG